MSADSATPSAAPTTADAAAAASATALSSASDPAPATAAPTSPAAAAAPVSSADMKELKDDDNTRGIPTAVFIDHVVEFVSTRGGADAVLRDLHNLYGKYKFMEGRLVAQKKALVTSKIPDITSALECLRTIIAKKAASKEMITTFQLSDAVYAKAKIKPSVNSVMLWLGANVMLEYDFKEAEALLSTNLKNAHTNLAGLNKDLSFLKDQITVSEVNIARVHNYRVKLTQEAKARAAAAAIGTGSSREPATAALYTGGGRS